MNDEIKNIINNIKSYENEELCLIFLSQKENKALLNYITNLQERKDKAIEYINKNYSYETGEFVFLEYRIHDDLLNILKGDKDE